MKQLGSCILTLVMLVAGLNHSTLRADQAGDLYTIAAGHYSSRRWKLAVTEFQDFLKRYPQHQLTSKATFLLGESLVRQNQYKQAATQYRNYIAKPGDSRYLQHAEFRLGESYYLASDFKNGAKQLQQFYKKYPENRLNSYVLTYLGEILLKQNNPKQALEQFTSSLKKYPQAVLADDCQLGRAHCLEKLQQTDQAIELYAQLSKKTNSYIGDNALFRLGILQYEMKKYELSKKALENHRRIFPNSKRHVNAMYRLSLVYKAQQDYDRARKLLLSAAKAAGDQHQLSPAIYFHAADCLVELKQKDDALQLFVMVAKTWPTDRWADDAVIAQLSILMLQKKHSQAEKVYHYFVKTFTKSELLDEAKRLIARSWLENEKYDLVVALFNEVVRQPQQSSQPATDKYLLALGYFGQKKYTQALKMHGEVLASLKEVQSPVASSTLASSALLASGSTLMAMKQYHQAIEPFSSYLEKYPTGTERARCLAEIAACHAHHKEFKKAKSFYQQLIEKHNDDEAHVELIASATHHLAELSYRSGQHDWAAELFGRLANNRHLKKYGAKGLSGLAWSHFTRNNFQAAAESFAKLVQQFPQDPLAAEAVLMQGKAFEKLNKKNAALALYHQVIEKYSHKKESYKELSEAILWAAFLHDQLNQQPQAIKLYQKFAKQYPKHPQIDEVLYQWAWSLKGGPLKGDQAAENSKQIETLFLTLNTQYQKSDFWADATYQLGEIQFAAKKNKEAKQYFENVLTKKVRPELAQHTFYMLAQIAIADGKWDQVSDSLTKLVQQHPTSKLRLQAEYWIAESAYRQNDIKKAGDLFGALGRKIQGRKEDWLAMVPLRQAQVFAHQKKWKEAKQVAEKLKKNYPKFLQLYEVDYLIGRCFASQAVFDQARTAYRNAINSEAGRGTETAAMAQWMIGETYFHQKNYESAIREYLRVDTPLYQYPRWKAAALLQAGKCYESLGQWNDATRQYTRLKKQYTNQPEAKEYAKDAGDRLRIVQQRVNKSSR